MCDADRDPEQMALEMFSSPDSPRVHPRAAAQLHGARGSLEENALSRAEEVSYGLYGVNALPEHRGAHAPVLLLRILDTARPVKPYSVLAKTTTK